MEDNLRSLYLNLLLLAVVIFGELNAVGLLIAGIGLLVLLAFDIVVLVRMIRERRAWLKRLGY